MADNKTNNGFYIFIILQGLVLAGLFSTAHKQKNYSEIENRTLAEIPAVSVNGIMDGTYQEQMEEGLKDQSYLKTASVETSAVMDMLMMHYDKNGTYFNTKGDYVKKETDNDYSDEHLMLISKIIGKFSKDTGKPVDLCLIPPKGSVHPEELPDFAPYLDDMKLREKVFANARDYDNLSLVSMENLLTSDKEAYFKTDHHYNSYGAYLASKDYLTSIGYPINDYVVFVPMEVGNRFQGSLYKKVPIFSNSYDQMIIPTNLNHVTITYSYSGDGKLVQDRKATSFYEPGYLLTKNKYNVYMGGNHGLAVIDNTEKKDGQVLFMIKDSFANSAVPYLISRFKRIVMIDLRYFSGSVQETVKKYDPDRIVFWYESLDFAQESRFPSLLR
ncbi:MAG: DHHW family protein [Candidatus Weimeria sp.]